ncbi:MAG: DUF1906 domain-containing protein [Corynebacterium sp.]|nr:DUF1906 domain-containing protein [Corynebacterium sp.]
MTTSPLSPSSSAISRRTVLKASAATVAAGSLAGVVAMATSSTAHALGPIVGTVIDYAAGVPSAAAIRAAGHKGAVRYVSQRRPGANWMVGKPVTLNETKSLASQGLATASVYQFGRAETADWKQGAAGAAVHAPQAISIHRAAGGPTGRPIYVAIDDNPTSAEYTSLIRPYLQAFQTALTAAGYATGVYGNYNVIDWCVRDGIGSFFWMHNWGSGGKIHPRTTIHQLPQNQQRTIDGVVVDINNLYAQDWGQWIPGQKSAPNAPAAPPAAPSAPRNPAAGTPVIPGVNLDGLLTGSSTGVPQLDQLSSHITPEQVNQATQLAQTLTGFTHP